MGQVYTVRLGLGQTTASEFIPLFTVPGDGLYSWITRSMVLVGVDATPRFAAILVGGAGLPNTTIFAADALTWARSWHSDARIPLHAGETLYLWASDAGAQAMVSGYRFQN